MPRPGPLRRAIAIRLSEDGIQHLQQIADRETGGNLSDLIRKLLTEAVTARAAKGPTR